MTCEKCEEYQRHDKGVFYVRVDVSNVEIYACPYHAKKIIDTLRQFDEQKVKESLR